VWEPLQQHLRHERLVLLSPTRELERLPFAALPGRQPGQYLLEEITIAYIPVPRDLPRMMAGQRIQPKSRENLLLVGGVDYDARAGSAIRDKDRRESRFESLPGTWGEVASIEKMYRDNFGDNHITLLERAAATEKEVLRLAPKFKYLHFATHSFSGFALGKHGAPVFASNTSPTFAATLTANHPGLLSGMVLAGANSPSFDEDDGILTAEELSTLNLSGTELAIVSNEGSVGSDKVSRNEGSMSLRRAFHVAGVETVIAAQWSPDDIAARDLMERFYDNLWNKNLSKVEALRESQLWMLKERGPRGLRPIGSEGETKKMNRLAPNYWAGFILSGDWR
jgi:CHAT domain-containing protein